MGFAPYESMADCIARVDGLEVRRAELIGQQILRSFDD